MHIEIEIGKSYIEVVYARYTYMGRRLKVFSGPNRKRAALRMLSRIAKEISANANVVRK